MKEKDREGAVGATEAVVATAAAVVATGGGALVIATAAAAPFVVKGALNALINRSSRKLDQWFGTVAQELGDDPSAVKDQFCARMLSDGHEDVARTVVDSVDALLRSVDTAAIPVLGALTASYIKQGAGPDAFFRGFARVASELTAEEFAVWRTLANEACRALEGGWAVRINTSMGAVFEVGNISGDGHLGERTNWTPPRGWVRVFQLLKANLLVLDFPRDLPHLAQAGNVWLEAATITAMHELLRS